MLPWIPNPLNILTAPMRAVAGALKSAGSALIGEAFDWIVGLMLSGVAWFFGVVWNFVSTSTTPDLYASWFSGGPYRLVSTLAVALLMLTVALAIAETIWNRDGAALLRSVAQDLPKAMFLLTGLLFITTLGIALADAITNALLAVFGGGIESFTEALTSVDNELAFGAGLIVIILLALLLTLVLAVVALELVFREGFIFVLVAITAIAIVFDVYRPTRGAGARAGRMLAGVIAAKPIIALCFAIGGAALGSVHSPSPTDGVEAVAEPGDTATDAPPAPGAVVSTDVAAAGGEDSADLGPTSAALLAGLATMALAAFAPFVVLKLFPVADATVGDGARSAVTSKAVGTATIVAAAGTGGAGSAGAANAAAGGGAAGGSGPGGTSGGPGAAGGGAAAGMAGGS